MPFINADILARELFPKAPEAHSYDAAKLAEELRKNLLQDQQSFCFETVFSHPSKIDFLAQAKTLGYEIILVFIHLDSVALNQARVQQRVAEGGHDVPADKVESRIPRLLKHIKQAMPLCDHVRLLDNSRVDNPFQQLANILHGELTVLEYPLPGWAKELLEPSTGE